MVNESNLAFRAAVADAIEHMADVATSQYAWDDPIGRHYHVIVIAARAYLEEVPPGTPHPCTIPIGGVRESGPQ